jgi:phenylpropionate dioxygenase-like ring-hydroxylating dioxygenase large terminal subunit
MKRATQIEVLRALIEQLDQHRTCDAGKVAMSPASAYTDPALAQREWAAFFAGHPQVLGLSGELPKPGSYFTSGDLGIPILATRDASGRFHAFVNACRHRGAELTAAPRGEASRFVCPFHAWTYAPDGRLVGIREAGHFGEVDKSCHGLVELPSEEKYGLLVVHPQTEGKVDVNALLGPELAEELAAWELDRAVYQGESVLDKPLNWKIANDTFGEIYHFSSLHRNTLANLLHGDIATYREWGRNHRIALATKYIDAMRELPEAEWSLPAACAVAYHVFPNVQIVFLAGMCVLARIYPNRERVDRSLTRVSHYASPQVAAQLAEAARVSKVTGDNLYQADTSAQLALDITATLELFVSTVEHEDYAMGEKTQAAANSGRLEYFLFGRNEPAIHHFHNNYRSALGMPPLAEYRAG